MTELLVRRATDDDLGAILELLAASMQSDPNEPFDALFRWKHVDNPFGTSPSWVAIDGERIVGLRMFLRWEFKTDGGGVVRAVRAVDTATHPDFQGRGIFTTLTMRAIDDLPTEGVPLIFNTPNEKSRPGYLKMGWSQVGVLPTSVRVTKVRSLPRIATSRVPANTWSIDTDRGVDPAEALADTSAVERLLASQPPPGGLATNRSPAFLRWRYGLGELHYRAVPAKTGIHDGVAFFRLRRRGRAVETVLADVIVPGGDRSKVAALAAQAARMAGSDYAISIGPRPGRRWFPVPIGPILTARSVDAATAANAATANNAFAIPPLAGWRLNLGDVELF